MMTYLQNFSGVQTISLIWYPHVGIMAKEVQIIKVSLY